MTEETRKKVFAASGYFCMVCGAPVQKFGTPQIAHRIHKGRESEDHIMAYLWNKYQKDRGRAFVREHILENPLNLRAVCSGKCNDKCNIFYNPVARDVLIDEIIKETGCLALK